MRLSRGNRRNYYMSSFKWAFLRNLGRPKPYVSLMRGMFLTASHYNVSLFDTSYQIRNSLYVNFTRDYSTKWNINEQFVLVLLITCRMCQFKSNGKTRYRYHYLKRIIRITQNNSLSYKFVMFIIFTCFNFRLSKVKH